MHMETSSGIILPLLSFPPVAAPKIECTGNGGPGNGMEEALELLGPSKKGKY